jgi:predicted dehydrogenase
MVSVGVIGVGAMGQHHVRIFSSMDGVRLVGIADIDKERAERVAAKYKVRAYSLAFASFMLNSRISMLPVCLLRTQPRRLM